MRGWLKALIEGVGEDLDRRRRATVLLTMSVAVLLANPIFTLLFWVGGSAFTANVVVLSGAGPLASLVLLRARHLEAAGHAFVGIFLFCLQLANLTNGGVYGLGLWWSLMMPVIATVVLGARAGAFWLGVTMAGFLAYGVGQFAGVEVTQQVPEWALPIVMGFGGAFLAGLLYLFVWQYERSNAAMRARLVDEERRTRHAHERVRLVLDSGDEGFCLLQRDGTVESGLSRVLAEWLGDDIAGRPWAEVIGRHDPAGGALFALGWEALLDDVLPAELSLAQLPHTLRVGARTLRLSYVQVAPLHALEVVVTVTDTTDQLAALAAEREQRELASILVRLAADPAAMSASLDELDALLRQLGPDQDRVTQLRALHTVKGNAGMFGMTALALTCHEVEQGMLDEHRPATDEDRQRVRSRWEAALSVLAPVLKSIDPKALTLPRPTYRRHLDRLYEGDVRTALHQALSWGLSPVQATLERVGEQARHLARRLGKGEITVEVNANGLRVADDEWAPFWVALAHVTRNAVDHGLETPEQREAAAKPPVGRLALGAELTEAGWTVWARDDGRGVDWDAIARRAQALGLPIEGPGDLEAALFADGVTARTVATETSGRGIGMAAVAVAVRERGGTVHVESVPGQGTVFRFAFPRPTRIAADEPQERAAA